MQSHTARALAAFALLVGAASWSGAAVATEADEARRSFDEALAARAAGDLTAATHELERATQLVPEWGLAHLELGVTRLALDPDDEDGVRSLERAAALEPQNPRAHLTLGLAYERARRVTDAARELRTALERRPDLVDARYALAEVTASNGDAPGAIALYREVLAARPADVGSFAALAELYEKQGDLSEAETALLSIVRLLPAQVYHRYRLAEFYERTGHHDKAQQVFDQVERMDPRQRPMRKLPYDRR